MPPVEKPRGRKPIKLAVNPHEVKAFESDPRLMESGTHFRLIEEIRDSDGKVKEVPMDSRGVEILDLLPDRDTSTKKEGEPIGKALIRLPKYPDVNFGVKLVVGPIPSKEEYKRQVDIMSGMGNPRLTLDETIHEVIDKVGKVVRADKVGLVLPKDDFNVEGGNIQYYSIGRGVFGMGPKRVKPQLMNVTGESNIGKAMMGIFDSESLEPTRKDLRLIGKFSKMRCVPLFQTSDGETGDLVGLIVLMNKEDHEIGDGDLNTLDLVSSTIARGLQTKAQLRTDPISGARNKTHFVNNAQINIQDHFRDPELMVIAATDLDHFGENIAEPFGQFAGTAAIQQYVKITKDVLQHGYLGQVGAYGGDEFAISIPWDFPRFENVVEQMDHKNPLEVLEEIRKKTAEHRFEVRLPKEYKDSIVFGDKFERLVLEGGGERYVVKEGTQIVETKKNVLLRLPAGAITVTIGAAKMDEVNVDRNLIEDGKLDDAGEKVYRELIELAFGRAHSKKHTGLRNTVING